MDLCKIKNYVNVKISKLTNYLRPANLVMQKMPLWIRNWLLTRNSQIKRPNKKLIVKG